MGLLIVLLIVLGIGYRLTSPEDRLRLLRAGLVAGRAASLQLKDALKRDAESETFDEALRARTPRALVTPALVTLNAAIFLLMLFGAGSFSDPETLIGWGGSFGPRTTNGEWWRLVTAMFVHSGMLHLLVNIAALFQVGLILERLVGRLTFAAVYITAGVFAGLLSLSAYPLTLSTGASGAVFGVYGLLLASCIWGLLDRSGVAIPLVALKRLGPAAGVFLLYNMASESVPIAAELVGFVAGLISGLVLARGAGEQEPPPRRVAITMAATVVIAVACAVPLRGLADVRPEIERLVAIEDRTAGAYRTAVDRFKSGRITVETLAQVIDGKIMPELQTARARLKTVGRVPPEHQPLVARAEEYLRLRDESWRLRADGLRRTTTLTRRGAGKTERASTENPRLRAEAEYKANTRALAKAEESERASLAAFQRMKAAQQP